MFATFGWDKALGDDQELGWWEERVREAVRCHSVAIPSAAR
jgi:hypothetical protein